MNAKNSYVNFSEPYYIGVDIGTESVGYAATDTDYKPLKFKGDPMLGVTLFDPASQCDKRRAARSARRRLDRRQTRVNLIQELFCDEIAKADPMFLKGSRKVIYVKMIDRKVFYAVLNGITMSIRKNIPRYITLS